MNIEEARAIIAQMNAQERVNIPEQLKQFALAQMGVPVHMWVLSCSVEDVRNLQDAILAERLRLENLPDVYQLGQWNEAGKAWLNANMGFNHGQFRAWLHMDYFAVVVGKSCRCMK